MISEIAVTRSRENERGCSDPHYGGEQNRLRARFAVPEEPERHQLSFKQSGLL